MTVTRGRTLGLGLDGFPTRVVAERILREHKSPHRAPHTGSETAVRIERARLRNCGSLATGGEDANAVEPHSGIVPELRHGPTVVTHLRERTHRRAVAVGDAVARSEGLGQLHPHSAQLPVVPVAEAV